MFSAYLEHLRLRGRGNTAYTQAARSFLRRWPHVQDWADIALHRQLAANSSTRPFVTFLMVTGRLQPGYDYLLARKLSSLWHDLTASPLEPDLIRFISAAIELAFTLRIALGWRLLPLRTFGPRLQQLRQVGEQLRGLAARNTTGSNTAGYQ